MNRTCDGCSECCKGWLHGHAMGHDFYPGKKCYYLQKTCSIYENRPINPCQTYKCHWLASDDLPMWMRPDLCGALMTEKQTTNNIQFFVIAECGSKMDSEVLSWFVMWALNSNKNIYYQVNGGWNRIGSREFLQSDI